ncbi:Histidine--tRNA ligase, cytoplasmic [Porphyridium purpureum]|uniref:Histidine--tRNA ligase, cytoplasmic n=1 Tax=Porphyridium purpureum TaxID=35688 RepID=A0A5J4YVI9_PORPP|nr:Histidine--tRNA ligase, cytoplasmic [Porphyridium purpureum]|eukprot:POR1730..scf227_4
MRVCVRAVGLSSSTVGSIFTTGCGLHDALRAVRVIGGKSAPVAHSRKTRLGSIAIRTASDQAVAGWADSNMSRRVTPKVAKGTRDFGPQQMVIREKAFRIVSNVFEKHGAVTIDTPVFELKETLVDQYGEDSKLIYDIADQGGELLSLRYDLTVPFARYLALNKISQLKRYHISRVYRRDQPSVQRGRFREFYQCDYDVAGDYPSMVPDSEVLKVLTELLDTLASISSFHAQSLGNYKIKINHRGILDGIFTVCGVPQEKLRAISSAVDKLDKESWENVRKEMVQTKGLSEASADRIGTYVTVLGEPKVVLDKLRSDAALVEDASAKAALDDMERLFMFCDAMGESVTNRLSFDLSLARGLDYYTGVIFEVVLTDGKTALGSIAAGGRYDNLVGMFSNRQVKCVGCSLGIERVMAIMEKAEEELAKSENRVIRSSKTQVLVASIGKGDNMICARMALASELWAAGIAAEFSYAENPKMPKQLAYALESGIPLVAIFGETELENGIVQLKNLAAESQSETPREELSNVIRHLLKDM